MKEFDLDKAIKGAPVCTRDGRPARIVCWDAVGEDLPILALVLEKGIKGEDIEFVHWYTKDGKSDEEDESDLMMVTTKQEGWVLVTETSYGSSTDLHFGISISVHGRIFDSKEHAIEATKLDGYKYLTVVHVEWEE